jgi:predicted TIM-barrel fold metal-dependent hydrolase
MEAYSKPIIDGDSHVYEDVTAWMSYMPSDQRDAYMIERREIDGGRFAIHIGGKPISFGEEYMRPDGTIPKPGSLAEWLRARKDGADEDHLWVHPTPDVRNVKDRLIKMDEFNVAASVVFPSDAITLLPFLDVKGLNVVMETYNRYLLDYWNFVTDDRVYCTVMLHLEDLDWAIKELDWALAHGCKAIAIPTGPAQRSSPADPKFDAFWARVNEAKAICGLHIGQATYLNALLAEWGEPYLPPVTEKSAWDWMNTMGETPIVHTLSSMIYMNFFERFPNIRALSAENGAEWVPAMLTRMDKMRGFAKNGRWPCGQMKERPSAVFKRHVFVVPYPEDDMRQVIDATGTADCFVMGSDYPHAEGCAEPRVFMAGMKSITAEEERKIMYDNGAKLLWG